MLVMEFSEKGLTGGWKYDIVYFAVTEDTQRSRVGFDKQAGV